MTNAEKPRRKQPVGRPFPKGTSGNPNGRPAGSVNRSTEMGRATLKALAATHAPAAVKTLADIAADPMAPPAARVAACNAILDRAFGRPVPVHDDDAGTPPVFTIEIGRPMAASSS